MKHVLANERERARALKRGGDAAHFPLDVADAEARYGAAIADRRTPDSEFERLWARTLVDRVIDRLRDDAARRGRAEEFAVLRNYLIERCGWVFRELFSISIFQCVYSVIHGIHRYSEMSCLVIDSFSCDFSIFDG